MEGFSEAGNIEIPRRYLRSFFPQREETRLCALNPMRFKVTAGEREKIVGLN